MFLRTNWLLIILIFFNYIFQKGEENKPQTNWQAWQVASRRWSTMRNRRSFGVQEATWRSRSTPTPRTRHMSLIRPPISCSIRTGRPGKNSASSPPFWPSSCPLPVWLSPIPFISRASATCPTLTQVSSKRLDNANSGSLPFILLYCVSMFAFFKLHVSCIY